ncbi:MAG: helix-turn-helix transcriptional regulator [Negativicutes bacterium]|nr:helix-turn-helix transcriptional regulator [Negativicutes bacterium]
MDYPKRMKDLMLQKGITNIWEFARNIGLPGPTVDGILNRTQRSNGPRIDTLEKICAGLGVTVGEFLGETKTAEETIFSRYQLSEDDVKFLAQNISEPGFREAVTILRSLPASIRAIFLETCLKHKGNNS